MWCKNNNCCHYDKLIDTCKRKGEDKENKDKVGICWMTEREYNHGIKKNN